MQPTPALQPPHSPRAGAAAGRPPVSLVGWWHARRVQAAHVAMARQRERLAHWLDGVDAGTFARNGLLIRRNLLPPAQFDALREALLALPPTADRAIDAALRRQVPALTALLDHRAWLGMTRYVAGRDRPPAARLRHLAVAPVDTDAVDGPDTRSAGRDPQTLLHSDGWRPSMKAWFFLTDLGHDDAPLCYVPGSHRLTPARLAWERARGPRGALRIDKDELAALGLGAKPSRLVLPANTLLVLDGFGFHKRALPRRPGACLEVTTVRAGQ